MLGSPSLELPKNNLNRAGLNPQTRCQVNEPVSKPAIINTTIIKEAPADGAREGAIGIA